MKLIILDRDGVINHYRDNGIKSADEWTPLHNSMDAVALLAETGYTLAVTADQSGADLSGFSMQSLIEIHAKMHRLIQQAGGKIDGIWFCPHTETDSDNCHKPNIIINIIERFNAKNTDTWLVSDNLSSLQAIDNTGGKPVLVLTGRGKYTQKHKNLPEKTLIFDDLLAFSQYLIHEHAKQNT